MIFITAKFQVLPEHADAWPEISREFTAACRAEEGCLWFEWSRSLDDSDEYVLTEAFRDGDAAAGTSPRRAASWPGTACAPTAPGCWGPARRSGSTP